TTSTSTPSTPTARPAATSASSKHSVSWSPSLPRQPEPITPAHAEVPLPPSGWGYFPVSPTRVFPGQSYLHSPAAAGPLRRCPILGAKMGADRDPILVARSRRPARRTSRTGTIERSDNLAGSRSESSQRLVPPAAAALVRHPPRQHRA